MRGRRPSAHSRSKHVQAALRKAADRSGRTPPESSLFTGPSPLPGLRIDAGTCPGPRGRRGPLYGLPDSVTTRLHPVDLAGATACRALLSRDGTMAGRSHNIIPPGGPAVTDPFATPFPAPAVETPAPAPPRRRPGRGLLLAGVGLAVLGLAACVAQYQSGNQMAPWYMPTLATLGA